MKQFKHKPQRGLYLFTAFVWLAAELMFVAPVFGYVQLSDVHKKVLMDMPLILEAQKKVEAQEAKLRSETGAFDHKIKAKTLNQFEDKYDYQWWQVALERQLPVAGLQLFAGQRQGTGVFPVYEGKYTTSSRGELFAGIQIPVLRNLLMDEPRLQRNVAQREALIAKQDLIQKQLDILLKSSELYWKWLSTSTKVKIYEDLVRVATERQGFFEKKFKFGDLEKIKITDNLRSLSKRQAEYNRALQEWKVVQLEFGLFVGLETLPQRQDIHAQFPDYLSSEWKKPQDFLPRMSTIPALKVLDFEKEQLELTKEFARSQRLPELNVMLEGSKEMSAVPAGEDPDELRVGVKIEIPIENNKALGKEQEANAKIKGLKHLRDWLEGKWRTSLEQVFQQLGDTLERLKIQKVEVESSEKMAQAERIRLQQGDSDIFFVNIREQDAADAQAKFIDTQAQFFTLLAQYQALSAQWILDYSL
jgi:cobalt-zinc-cadmium efflux system outer membrane protein